MVSINKSKIKLRSNLIYFPLNNIDGNYNLVTDLSSIKDLKSLSVIVYDPTSVSYIGQNNEVLYSYQREATCRVNSANISFFTTGKNIMVQLIDLPDTTITANDFIAITIANRLGNISAHVKSCTSVLKRKMITFKVDFNDTVEDIKVPEVNVKVYPNPMVSNVSVEFLLTKEENVKTVIYDYLGRQIQVIANKTYYAGENTLDYDATSLISGVYIIKFEAGSFQKSIKVVKH